MATRQRRHIFTATVEVNYNVCGLNAAIPRKMSDELRRVPRNSRFNLNDIRGTASAKDGFHSK